MNQTDNNCQEAKPQQIEKMLREMAVLHVILYITIRRDDMSGLHKIHWW